MIIGFLGSGCDSQRDEIDAFIASANRAPMGFVRTDEIGTVIEEDRDDWRVSPIFAGRVSVSPAYPNPVSSGFVTIPVTVRDFSSVRGGLALWARDVSGRLRVLDEIPGADQPGVYVFNFAAALIGRTGLVRLFILDGTQEIVSYGDLLIEG